MRVVRSTAVFVCVVVALLAFGSPVGAAATSRKAVVASFYPLAYAAEQVGGSRVKVDNLTPAGAEPHDLELTPHEVEEILDADLVLYVGEGFQPAVEEAAAESNGESMDALEGLQLREGDPHVWLDPVLFAQVVERIGAQLGREAPAGQLVSRLNELDEAYKTGLADCDHRELVTTHDAFGYLADRYGLEVVPITGLSPEAEPSPQDLEAVVDLVEASGVTTVFTETLLSPEVGETVAREAGATTAVLNPIEGLTEHEIAAGDDYFSVMETNLDALRTGLGCR